MKLSVARQRSNPKVFMWSSLWEDAAPTNDDEKSEVEQEPKQEEIFNNITSFGAVEEMEIAKEDVKQEKEEKMVTENGQTDNTPSDSNNSGIEHPVEAKQTKEKPVIASQIDNNVAEQKAEVTEETKSSATQSAPQENPSNFGSELAEYFSSEGP